VLGAGETLLALTSSVSLQREAPPAVLARVFGVLESLVMASIAVGSLATGLLGDATGYGPSLAILGGAVAVLVVLGVWRLAAHGEDPDVVDDQLVQCLLADPVMAPLAAPVIERLARNAAVDERAPGEVIVAEGEPGEQYFVVRRGTLRVEVGGAFVRELGPGHAFGEIALLRDVPRTATVTAITAVTLVAVGRVEFLEAVTGHPRSLRTAAEVASRLLAGDPSLHAGSGGDADAAALDP
jgi:Cyclic nucleotide-binding domain